MRILIILVLAVMNLHFAFGQEARQTIRGTVIDKQTRQPLAGVTIILIGSEPLKGCISNVDGSFRLDGVPMGRQAVKATYIGYSEAIIANLIVASAKELVLEVGLEEKVSGVGEATVIANDKSGAISRAAIVSARTFTVEETQRYAGAFQDPARLAANYAGVVSANDERNDIIIRGNSPTGLLWRLEGIDIPNPNHFAMAGMTGGGISILNNNNLSNSDFFTGAFPAEYGGALGGVFDLKLKNGNNEKREYMAQAGFAGLELGLEGPLFNNNGGSFIANYRYSTISVLDKLGVGMEDFPGIPAYQDLVFKINFPDSKSLGVFSLFGMGGMSEMEFKFKNQDDDDFDTYDENELKNSSDKHRMGVIGVSNAFLLTNDSYLQSTLALTSTINSFTVDTITNFAQNQAKLKEDMEFSEYDAHFSVQYNKKFGAADALASGVYIKTGGFDYLDSIYDKSIGAFQINNDFSGEKTLIQAYSDWQHKFSDEVIINTGLHYDYFTFNHTWSLEPRLGVKWKFSPLQALSLGAGLHSQLQPFIYYLFETETPDGNFAQTNKNMGFSRSAHAVLGYDYNFTSDFRFKAEGYYQSLYGIPVESAASYFSMLNAGSDFKTPFADSLVNEGTGRNYGLELTLEKFFSDGYYFLSTASFYNSKYKGSDGVERNTVFNGSYAFNLLGGYEWNFSEATALFADLKICFMGNKRKIPIDISASTTAGEAVYDKRMAFEERLKDYFKTDLKFGCRFNTENTSHYIVLEVRNLFDTKNVFNEMYDYKNKRIAELYQMTLLPNLYYKIEF